MTRDTNMKTRHQLGLPALAVLVVTLLSPSIDARPAKPDRVRAAPEWTPLKRSRATDLGPVDIIEPLPLETAAATKNEPSVLLPRSTPPTVLGDSRVVAAVREPATAT